MAKPRPKSKSEETSPDTPGAPGTPSGPVRASGDSDPAVTAFTQALEAFHRQDWSQAAELFETALAESDRLDLSARARHYLATSRQKVEDKAVGGKAFRAEEQDPFLRAVYDKNRGEYADALKACSQEGRDQNDERFAYLAASVHAAEGRIDEAVQALTRAIELNPKNRVHAYHDPDFAEIRKNRDYRPIFGLS
jgi:tetratricopeptide (TPR) repeat protein